MNMEINSQWQFTEDGGFGQVTPYITTTGYCVPMKSAREQVQDEILIKIQKALTDNDLPRARELAELGKQITEF